MQAPKTVPSPRFQNDAKWRRFRADYDRSGAESRALAAAPGNSGALFEPIYRRRFHDSNPLAGILPPLRRLHGPRVLGSYIRFSIST
jgi:hypothetical protein